MKRLCALALFVGLLASGCGKGQTSSSSSPPTAAPVATAVLSLPATLDGQLVIDHSSDFGVWGTFTANASSYEVKIPASVYDASSLGDSGGLARLTLSAIEPKASPSDVDLYVVSAAVKR